MTDKQIIDGVDVSGCWLYLVDGSCTEGHFKWCKDNNYCHFKNWQRKEQECERLKEIILQAIKDFSLEYGTPQYDRLLNGAKQLGIEVKDYE